jgi:hypothetical protein
MRAARKARRRLRRHHTTSPLPVVRNSDSSSISSTHRSAGPAAPRRRCPRCRPLHAPSTADASLTHAAATWASPARRPAFSPRAVCRNSQLNTTTVGVTHYASVPPSRSRERSGSVGRMEALLIALQVEPTTEKRNNVEAERHINALNREVSRLQLENARLSLEVAGAAMTAAASVSTSPPMKTAGAAASVTAATSAPVMGGALLPWLQHALKRWRRASASSHATSR